MTPKGFPWGALLITVAVAGLANAEPVQMRDKHAVPWLTYDTATLTKESDAVAVLEYLNHPAQNSRNGVYEVTDDGLTCHIRIKSGYGAELASVTCSDGWAVDPVGEQEVKDGPEPFVFLIYRPLG